MTNNKTQKSDVLHGRAPHSAPESGSRLLATYTLPLLLFAPAACSALLALIFLVPSRAHAQTFTTRWEQLERAAEQRWRTVSDDAPAPRSLAAALSAVALYDQLRARLDDPADPLEALDRFQPALTLDGVPRTLYDRAEHLLRVPDLPRALHLFTFLTKPSNTNGFTRGNSFYWCGVLLDELYRDHDRAFDHFILVHRYPACLAYTDCAYLRTAHICRMRGHYDTALALYAIRIPSVDYHHNELLKASASAELARCSGDLTNYVRQVMRAELIARAAPEHAPSAARLRAELTAVASSASVANIAAYVEAAESFDLYAMQAISRALTGPDAATNNPALADMLLHDWPSLDAVAELHPEILTNRPASNNIFEQLRLSIPITPLP